ncbi:MAG: aminotransferase class I/II-fold pyridoxal phosphate-dependent enzyme [Armatimonadetes bacterium]|nr:aminotransferase class I/II-fold pyridoxal phosphate-dependent enzyme [Armatimonadota bacterium]MBS1704133.1 aminotransferase class I/II-fold pyridoxal phosphate-dependent enzyme [Armatimonadota bacterium]
MSIVDLRSDTVTRPTPDMYEAMMNAPLGDDVLGDEPTVSELESLAAKMTVKEAALFVPSGTMGNQVAIATHTQPGQAIIVEQEAHVIYYEVGAPAVFANVLTWTLPSDKGVMDPADIEKRITSANLHTPGTSLICIEDTHNRAGGTIIPLDTIAEYRRIADKHGLKLHMDGARAFNAAVALGVPIGDVTRNVDTVSICLSKGLRSPVGSILCGPKEFIDRARIWRKRMGGGLRQSGVLAACGLVSLTKYVDRLADDHANAQRLAVEIGKLPGLHTDPANTPTNICLVGTDRPAVEWQAMLHGRDVWCFPVAENRIRLVTHADVDSTGVDRAIEVFTELAG